MDGGQLALVLLFAIVAITVTVSNCFRIYNERKLKEKQFEIAGKTDALTVINNNSQK